MYKYYVTGLLILISTFIHAGIKGIITDSKGAPLPGVNVRWENSPGGTITDLQGNFEIEIISNDRLIFSNVGFLTDTISSHELKNNLQITLEDNIQLKDLEVTKRFKGSYHSRTATIEVETMNDHEFEKMACCNLSESFSANPSVDVSYSDAVTGAKQIRLLGLSGQYVQMLTENIPNFRGLSSLYGMNYIPGPWMESITVSKGTGSVVNGYEAIAGQINVDYKKPDLADKVSLNLYTNDAGRYEVNADASIKLNNGLSTGILLHTSDDTRSIDQNNDGYMDIPRVKQYNFINRWYYKKDGHIFQAFVKALSEDRKGGTVDNDYLVDIHTERYEFFLKNSIELSENKGNLDMTASASMHSQDAIYGSKTFDGKQENIYLNVSYLRKYNDENLLKSGFSFNYDNFHEQLSMLDVIPPDTRELVPGLFTEYEFSPAEALKMVAGFRADYNSLYGTLLTPRFHLRFAPSHKLHVRLTAGKGYRSPEILAENNFYLASNRQFVITEKLKMEEAWNYGASIHTEFILGEKEIGLMGEWYYADFMHQVIADLDTDPHKVQFINLDGKSYSSSVQFEANTELFEGMNVKLAHRISDVKYTVDGQLREKPLNSRYKTLLNISYETLTKTWGFDMTAVLNGGGRMPDPDIQYPLWTNEFKAYPMLNAQITKFQKNWSVYLGVENLTNFVQKDPIVDVNDPFGSDFDATMVYGPTDGRKIYLGFRWALKS